MIGNTFANNIMGVSKNSQPNNLEAIPNENDKKTPKEIYISRRKTENHR